MRLHCLLGFVLVTSLAGWGCRQRSFDEIAQLVSGKSGAEVEEILGKPNSKQEIFPGDQRWTWWNYTFLEGESYPPEQRGRKVHLQISLSATAGLQRAGGSPSDLRVSDPLAVSFLFPSPTR